MKEFQSQVFCLTGAVPGFSRGDLWEHIAARDGEFSEHMNKSVTILVVGERGQGTSKYEKALQYGTEIMEYEQFMAWLFRTPVIDPDAHLRPLNKPKRIGGAHVVAPTAATVQGSGFKVQGESFDEFLGRKLGIEVGCPAESAESAESMDSLNSKPSTLNYLSSLAAAIGTILVIIGKAVLFICGLSICVVLWLCGIPITPKV